MTAGRAGSAESVRQRRRPLAITLAESDLVALRPRSAVCLTGRGIATGGFGLFWRGRRTPGYPFALVREEPGTGIEPATIALQG